MVLTQKELHDALSGRHGAAVQAQLDRAAVGIAGLGGLGSHIAVSLARLGVGRLVLVDFDVVDVTNLNRQHYTMITKRIPSASFRQTPPVCSRAATWYARRSTAPTRKPC